MRVADSARSSGLRRHYRPTPGKHSVRFLLLLSNHSAGHIGADGEDLKVFGGFLQTPPLKRPSTSGPGFSGASLRLSALNSLLPLELAHSFGTPHCRTGSAPNRARCDVSSQSNRRTPGRFSQENSLSAPRNCSQPDSTLLALRNRRDSHPDSLPTNNGFPTHLFGYGEFHP